MTAPSPKRRVWLPTLQARLNAQLFTDLATVLATSCVLQQAWSSALFSIQRAIFLSARTGLSRTVSLLFLNFLIVGQLFSCLILLVPLFYLTIGLVVPCVLLGLSLLFHAIMFEIVTSPVVAVRVLTLSLVFTFFAFLRYDRKARNLAQELPTSDWILNLEEGLRQRCVKVRTAVWGLPAAVAQLVFFVHSLFQYCKSSGARAELEADVLQLRMACLSFSFIIVSQDRRTLQNLQDLVFELFDVGFWPKRKHL